MIKIENSEKFAKTLEKQKYIYNIISTYKI